MNISGKYSQHMKPHGDLRQWYTDKLVFENVNTLLIEYIFLRQNSLWCDLEIELASGRSSIVFVLIKWKDDTKPRKYWIH